MPLDASQNLLTGYAFLIDKHRLNVMPNWHASSVNQTGMLRSTIQEGQVDSVYPLSYWPGESTGDQLEFALKYDGINLGILAAVFQAVPEEEITGWISSKPTGKYARKIWFLFEFITGKELFLPNLTKGNYIALLEPERYYTISPGRRIQRHRVIDNLLGGRSFCPIIRRTDRLVSDQNN